MKKMNKKYYSIGGLILFSTPIVMCLSHQSSTLVNKDLIVNQNNGKTVFAPYLDPTQSTANIKEAYKATNNRLNSVTLAFLNRVRGKTTYNFAGKSVADVKAMYSGIPNFSPIIAVGGVVAGDAGNKFLLPTLTPNDITPQSEEQIASQFWSIITQMNSHRFDWDIESWALDNDKAGVTKAANVAKILQDKANAQSYPLAQMLTMPTTGVWEKSSFVKPESVTKTDIDQVPENSGFSAGGVDAIKKFYNKNVEILANGMTMEYVWRTDYDAQTILTMGGMAKAIKAVRPNWTEKQVYAHVGATPMIGHQSQAQGIYTFDKGVKYTTQWAKALDIGYIGFWSLTRDHPSSHPNKWKNDPTSYGLATGTDYIYTNNFLNGLS